MALRDAGATVPGLDAATAAWRQVDNVPDDGGDRGGVANDADADERVAWLRSRLLSSSQVRDMPPPEPLIDGILTRSTFVVLWGSPGSGKSFIALDWAMSIGTGVPWFGHRVRRGPVLYVAAEGSGGLGCRIGAWEAARRTWDTDGAVQVLPVVVNMLDRSWIGPVNAVAGQLGAEMVVLDTLARSMPGGDENAAKDMGRLIDGVGAIQEVTKAAVLVVHHDRKDGATMRGSTALLGAADTSIALRSEGAGTGTAVTLRCEKSKDTTPFEPVNLWLAASGNSAVLDNRPPYGHDQDIPDTALDMLTALRDTADTEGVSTTVWLAASGVAARTFYRWQKRLVQLGFAATEGAERNRRYTLTEQGERRLDQ